MAINITYLSHSGFKMEIDGKSVLIDPFLSSPLSPMPLGDIDADFIILTHGHGDHSANAPDIAKRTGATVIANFEVANWMSAQGVQNTSGHNPGGGTDHGFGRVEYTPAWHSSSMPDGSYGGVACGVIIFAPGLTIYHAGDTALFSDMKLIGAKGIDVAMLPIGDHFTMGPADSIEAIKLIQPGFVIPIHYNTFPPIQQDAGAWAQKVQSQTGATPVVMKPGESRVF
ncbi:MAG TPA: metal-dependent hydrolase [Aggregatilineales bacterium]|nr:metal-dependent hydrolase [Aggregatilineales bacterium]